MAPAKPRILVAARPIVSSPVRQAVGADAEVIDAHTLDAAQQVLTANAGQIKLVFCTVYFDDSRMFDLLRWTRTQHAHIPFICARVFPKDITRISIEAVSIAATSLGAADFIDVPAIAAEHGEAEATSRLRNALLSRLAP